MQVRHGQDDVMPPPAWQIALIPSSPFSLGLTLRPSPQVSSGFGCEPYRATTCPIIESPACTGQKEGFLPELSVLQPSFLDLILGLLSNENNVRG